MKTKVEVWNQNTGLQFWTLDAIIEANCKRRMSILSGEGLSKIVQKKVTVHTTDNSQTQMCCHYTSFELRQMNAEKAIEIFNHDGSQKAKIINN